MTKAKRIGICQNRDYKSFWRRLVFFFFIFCNVFHLSIWSDQGGQTSNGIPDNTKEKTETEIIDELISKIQDTELKIKLEYENQLELVYSLPEEEREAQKILLSNNLLAKEAEIEYAFQDLVQQYPDSADPLIALGNFHEEHGREHEAFDFWTKASRINPNDPAIWNNLAGYHTHNGGIRKSFEYFQKAIDLKPKGWVYYHNFANTVFLFRKDARMYYHLNEQEVFDKAFELYSLAFKEDPKNYDLAVDIANSYYIVRPYRSDDALKAWQEALSIATTSKEKQSVTIHQARWLLRIEKIDEALEKINQINHPELLTLKKRVKKNILKKREISKSP